MSGPWRDPDEESVDLYPGLVVCDNRVTGSITVGRSRLPLWAFARSAIANGWDEADDSYDLTEQGYTARDLAGFVGHLVEMRGEWARLLLVLADAERCDYRGSYRRPAWWQTKRHRKRVGDQLRRCLATLESEQKPS